MSPEVKTIMDMAASAVSENQDFNSAAMLMNAAAAMVHAQALERHAEIASTRIRTTT